MSVILASLNAHLPIPTQDTHTYYTGIHRATGHTLNTQTLYQISRNRPLSPKIWHHNHSYNYYATLSLLCSSKSKHYYNCCQAINLITRYKINFWNHTINALNNAQSAHEQYEIFLHHSMYHGIETSFISLPMNCNQQLEQWCNWNIN